MLLEGESWISTPRILPLMLPHYTEEALSGHDIKVTGQIPYIPWAKIKGTHYYWDQLNF
jgi:hypothetical protein